MSQPLILLVEKDNEECQKITQILSSGYRVVECNNPNDAMIKYEDMHMQIRIVLLNLDLENNSINLLQKMKQISILPEIIVYSSDENMQLAVDAMKNGAYTYFSKPYTEASLLTVVDQTLGSINIVHKLENYSRKNFLDSMDHNKRDELIEKLLQEQRGKERGVSDAFSVISPNVTIETTSNDHLDSAIAENDLKPTVLIIEDEALYRKTIKGFLSKKYNVLEAESGERGLALLKDHPKTDVILLDIFLPDTSGTDLLPKLKTLNPDVQVVVVTAFEFVDIAVQTLREGACDYVNKPFLKDTIISAVDNAVHQKLIDKVIPQVVSHFVEKKLSYECKVQLLNELCTNRRNSGQGVFMEDIYMFFPEMKKTCIPEGLLLPPNVIKDDIEGFIESLKAKVPQFNPNVANSN
jgi:DNA-binding NtrC family response regulator